MKTGAIYNARRRRIKAKSQAAPARPDAADLGRLIMMTPREYRDRAVTAETAAALYITDMGLAIRALQDSINTHVAFHRTLVDILNKALSEELTSECRHRITFCRDALLAQDPDNLARAIGQPNNHGTEASNDGETFPGLRVVASNDGDSLPGLITGAAHRLPKDARTPDTCACFPGQCRGGEVIDGKLASGLRCKACKPAPHLSVVSAVGDGGAFCEADDD